MIWYILLGSLLASAATGAAVWLLANRLGAKSLESARTEATEILRDAHEEAEKEKKQALLAAREKWYKTKSQMEKEAQNRQRSLQKLQKDLEEKELVQRESANALKRRDQSVRDREKRVSEIESTSKEKVEKLAHLVEEENAKLERISGLTADEAKNLLLTNLKQQTRFEAAALIKEIKEDAQLQGEAEAQKIIALAIERQAADYSNERTATSVPIPNEKIKGRLIGLEGRNIKAFEKFTGIQLVVDDSPDTVLLSGFNPIK